MLELTLRIGGSLLVVLGLLWVLARLVRGPVSRRGRAVALLGRQQLTRGSSVAVIRVADRALVLGVTDQRVSLLAETDLSAVTAHLEPAALDHAAEPRAVPGTDEPLLAGSLLSPGTWRQTVDFFRDQTVRRPRDRTARRP